MTGNGGEVNGASSTLDSAKRSRVSKSGEPKTKKTKTVNPRDVNGTKTDKGTVEGSANNT